MNIRIFIVKLMLLIILKFYGKKFNLKFILYNHCKYQYNNLLAAAPIATTGPVFEECRKAEK